MTLMREANMMADPEEGKRYGLIAVPVKAASVEDWEAQVREMEEEQRQEREAREREEREVGRKVEH